MVVAICQSNYIPWKGYFDMINYSDLFVIYDHVQYTKNDWRNRNLIMTQEGKRWLTIPVRRKSLEQTIGETEVALQNWRKKHLKTLASVYSKARFFDPCYNEIRNIYEQINSNNLSIINETILCGLCKILEIGTTIKRSTDFVIVEGKTEALVSICRQAGATRYLSGPSAKAYLDVSKFEREGISVEWMDYSCYPRYTQLGKEFDHFVSIVDLIFNTGGYAHQFMKSFTNEL